MTEESDFDFGTAGASARREHERRRAKREARVRKAHPHLGDLLLRFGKTPQSEQSWASGAAGEEALAAHLARKCPEVVVLHDRRMPGSRANVDHLAIAPTGVCVIDAKRYKGKIEVRKPFFGAKKLVIAGRDKTKLVDGLKRQVQAVQDGLSLIEMPTPVHGCFCFLNPPGQSGGSGLPVFRTLSIDDFKLYYPRRLSKRLNEPGNLDRTTAAVLAEALAELFPVTVA